MPLRAEAAPGHALRSVRRGAIRSARAAADRRAVLGLEARRGAAAVPPARCVHQARAADRRRALLRRPTRRREDPGHGKGPAGDPMTARAIAISAGAHVVGVAIAVVAWRHASPPPAAHDDPVSIDLAPRAIVVTPRDLAVLSPPTPRRVVAPTASHAAAHAGPAHKPPAGLPP